MAKPRKLWSQLADSTKKRYKRNGVTPQQYNAGKIDRTVRERVYGKTQSLTTLIAREAGMETILKRAGIYDAYKRLPKAERKAISAQYVEGMIHGRGNPFDVNGRLRTGDELNRDYVWKGADFIVVPGENGKEFYFRREWDDRGHSKLIPIHSYGHPKRSAASLNTEQDFIQVIEQELGTVLDEADLWNDERRSALEASSP